MLLFLSHLEAGQVGVPQDELVFVFEVLRYGALDGLAVLLLQGEPAGEMMTTRDPVRFKLGLILCLGTCLNISCQRLVH